MKATFKQGKTQPRVQPRSSVARNRGAGGGSSSAGDGVAVVAPPRVRQPAQSLSGRRVNHIIGARQLYEAERDEHDEVKKRNMEASRRVAQLRAAKAAVNGGSRKRGAPVYKDTTKQEKLVARDNTGKNRELVIDSSTASIYGCCGIFDLCGDRDLMSLTFQGSEPFLDWLGWSATDVCLIQRNFISYVRPEMVEGEPTPGYVADPCADPDGVEWGVCDWELRDFARLRREGPVRDMTETDLRLCETQPRYRFDGTQINSDEEWDGVLATEVIMQDLKRMVITGDGTVEGQFAGLNQLVNDGYVDTKGRRCQLMDSMVVDWNGNSMQGGNGITVNGLPIGNTFNFVDVFMAVARRVWRRIKWAPALRAQRLRYGDQIILMPDFMIQCFLDAYTCWSVCPGVQFSEANINTLEARDFRNSLEGGLFGDGEITIHGQRIPILSYDWEMIGGDDYGDVFFLTGSIGGVKLLQGQYLNMNNVPSVSRPGYYATDGGRLLHWNELQHTCERHLVEFRPRLLSWAPWAQVRFQDASCEGPLGPISPDPLSSFFPLGSFSSARSIC